LQEHYSIEFVYPLFPPLQFAQPASYIEVKTGFEFPDTEMFVAMRMEALSIGLLTAVSLFLFVVILTAFCWKDFKSYLVIVKPKQARVSYKSSVLATGYEGTFIHSRQHCTN
jgi:hypothetical protein